MLQLDTKDKSTYTKKKHSIKFPWSFKTFRSTPTSACYAITNITTTAAAATVTKVISVISTRFNFFNFCVDLHTSFSIPCIRITNIVFTSFPHAIFFIAKP